MTPGEVSFPLSLARNGEVSSPLSLSCNGEVSSPRKRGPANSNEGQMTALAERQGT
jgi:hypothetical protein